MYFTQKEDIFLVFIYISVYVYFYKMSVQCVQEQSG